MDRVLSWNQTHIQNSFLLNNIVFEHQLAEWRQNRMRFCLALDIVWFAMWHLLIFICVKQRMSQRYQVTKNPPFQPGVFFILIKKKSRKMSHPLFLLFIGLFYTSDININSSFALIIPCYLQMKRYNYVLKNMLLIAVHHHTDSAQIS